LTFSPVPVDTPDAFSLAPNCEGEALTTWNLISTSFSTDDLAAINAAVATLEEKLAGLIELSVDERRGLNKMGDKTEAARRQTLVVLTQNRRILPPSFDFAEAERALATFDQLRPLAVRIKQRADRVADIEMALGSDILSSALEGYAMAKAAGKGARRRQLAGARVSKPLRRASDRPP
jgi:hypothetical protein